MRKFIHHSFFYVYLLSLTMSFYSCQNLTGNVSVNFQKKQPVNSMVGFLHFNDVYKLEQDVKSLKPKYWRFRWMDNSVDAVNFLIKNNVTPIIVLSDRYGYPDNLGDRWKSPLRSNDYKNMTKNIYLALGNKVIYDIWNEPYMSGFGGFSSKDFYTVFKQTHDLIRSLPGGENAQITGPSFEHFKRSEIEDFFQFCSENKIRLDVLSWHEWRNEGDLDGVTSDIQWLRNDVLPKYSSVGVKKIILTEIIHANIQFSPTQIFKVYDILEKNNIDGACRGCFSESNGVVNCENNSMTGLLDNKGRARSVWWATKLYAQSVNNRVLSKTDLDNIIPFASYDNYGAYLLLANNGNVLEQINITLSNLTQLPIFKNTKYLKVNIFKIPPTGENILDKPMFISSKRIKINNKILITKVEGILPKEIIYLSIVR